MAVSTNDGGSLEYVGTGRVFLHFQVVSNEIQSPRVLVCPQDTRRSPVKFGSSLQNANVSYFLGVDANEMRPTDILSGDRNVTNGTRVTKGLMTITPNSRIGWEHGPHNGYGNILMADISVQGWPTPWPALEADNRLEFP